MGAGAHAHVAGESGPGRQMHVRAHLAVVVHLRAGVEDAVRADSRPGLHDRPGHHLRALLEHRIRRDHRGRVRDGEKAVTAALQALEHRLALRHRFGRAHRVNEHGRARRMLRERLVIAQHLDAADGLAVLGLVRVGEARDRDAAPRERIEQHPGVPARADHHHGLLDAQSSSSLR